MDEAVSAYLRDPAFFGPDAELSYEEISEGNINHVYRVRDAKTGGTLVIKRAERVSRISPDIKLDVGRGEREYNYYRLCEQSAPRYLPRARGYDRDLRLIALEDMSPRFEVLRNVIPDGQIPDGIGAKLADYVVTTTFETSDFGLDHQRKKKLCAEFSNPELCDLTERLVFTEPITDSPENYISDANAEFAEKEVYSDPVLRTCGAGLKHTFMNSPQALIHGDLHFGSVFVSRDGDIAVFDPEFCFFGPIGYDLGNLYAHFLMGAIYHDVRNGGSSGFPAKAEKEAADLIYGFFTGFAKRIRRDCRDPMLSDPGFSRDFILGVIRDTAGFAGTECLRRAVGIAKIPEFSLLDKQGRAEMERRVIRAAKKLITEAPAFDEAALAGFIADRK